MRRSIAALLGVVGGMLAGAAFIRRQSAHRERADLYYEEGRQAFVDLGLAEPERDRRLAGTEERARDDGIRLDALFAKPAAESPRLVAAARRQCAQLVRAAGPGLGMADDQKAHRASRISPHRATPAVCTRLRAAGAVPLVRGRSGRRRVAASRRR